MPRNEFGNKKKKKKGRAPAHQNKFAYKHNPGSKKTERILSLPNIHVCQRCSDKIEWRKKYRKYKPRTQPGTCNECKKRNVTAAYHTICTKCTTESVKAKDLIKEKRPLDESSEAESEEEFYRACAVCVKELALPDPEEEDDERDYIDAMARLKLRQRRALERKIAREFQEAEEAGMESEEEEESNDESGDAVDEQDCRLEALEGDDDGIDTLPDYGDDEEDPFLKAIGGADKLLTGDAYRQKLMLEQQQNHYA